MSAVTAIHEQHAAVKQRLIVERDGAVACVSSHDQATRQKASDLAAMEDAYVAIATAEALGQEPTETLPDAGLMASLRAAAAAAEPVRRELVLKLDAAERALKAAESEHKASVATYLRETAVAPALDGLENAFEVLRLAAINLMAAHNLAYRKFDDRAPFVNNSHELYGPVAEWLHEVSRMDWARYPYPIRPSWIPTNGIFFAFDMPGVAERTAEILAEVEQVPA